MNSVNLLPKFCRRLYERELVSSTGGNLSVRTDSGTVLISPTGKALVDLEVDDFIEVTVDGRISRGGRPSKELPFHLAAYRTRPDVTAVIHGHCAYAVAASTLLPVGRDDSLPAYSAGYVLRVGKLPLLPYLPAGSIELSEAVASVLSPTTKAMLLQNHGFITVGPDLETSFNTADELLDALKVFVLSAGRARPLPDEARDALLRRVPTATPSAEARPWWPG
jgi:ribulose-5-phosphate 4-epimerase/fuculose-1-phosphate aldolase